MNAEWVSGRDPTEDQQYVVKVEVSSFHFQFPSVRRFKAGKWQELTPGERVVKWLDLEGGL
jgi:hypothetical protein